MRLSARKVFMREIRITPFCSPLTTSPEWRPMEREMKELMRQKELLLEEEVVPTGTTGPLHAPAPRREGCEKKRT